LGLKVHGDELPRMGHNGKMLQIARIQSAAS